jgi:hypothetical protein
MTRLFSFLALSALAMIGSTGQALAIAGGPFDNGLPSGTLEYPQNGYYAANLRFKNGNGYCYFNPSQVLVSEDQSTPTAFQARGTSRNRSVLYYKGITYVGAAFGMTDPGDGVIQCSLNASSEANFSAQTQAQNSTFFNFSASAVTVSNQVTASSRNFTCNGNWEGKLNRKVGQIRFTGKGELAFLAPNGADAYSNLALTSYSNFIGAIITYYASVGNSNQPPPPFSQGETAIASVLNRIVPFLSSAGIDTADNSADKVKISVRGSFRYVVTRI